MIEQDELASEAEALPPVFRMSGDDYRSLCAIADKRGYRVRRLGLHPVWWLEWREGISHPLKDPEAYFASRLSPFVPFSYSPAIPQWGDSPSVPGATFINGGHGWFDDGAVLEWAAEYVVELSQRVSESHGGLPRPGSVDWLISERDALFAQVKRVAERLGEAPSRLGNWTPPLHSINSVLRVWIVELEFAHLGEPDLSAADPWERVGAPNDLPEKQRTQLREGWDYAEHVWHTWVLGGTPSDRPFGDPERSVEALTKFGAPRSVSVGTAVALTYHLAERDRILRAAAPIIARWMAAEEVLVQVLSGEEVETERIAEAVARRSQVSTGYPSRENVIANRSLFLAYVEDYRHSKGCTWEEAYRMSTEELGVEDGKPITWGSFKNALYRKTGRQRINEARATHGIGPDERVRDPTR